MGYIETTFRRAAHENEILFNNNMGYIETRLYRPVETSNFV